MTRSRSRSLPRRPAHARRRGRTSTGATASVRLLALAVAALVSTTVGPASAVQVEPLPVTPEQAERITAELARKAPPLPADIARMLEAASSPVVAPAVEAQMRAMARHLASTGAFDRPAPVASNGVVEEPRDAEPNGKSCFAQGFDAQGVFRYPYEPDLNGNGTLDPWEVDPNRDETCTMLGWAWNQAEPEKGWIGFELRTETDADTGREYRRVAGRLNYVADPHAHADCTDSNDAQYATAAELVADTKAALAQYVNNPHLANLHGFWPYPVPATKKLHWFNSKRFTDEHTLVPSQVEMFVATVTDEGWVPVNVSYVYTHLGDDPFSHDPNIPGQRPAADNAGAGCFVEWHRHFEGAEGAATANFEGRSWMTHLWFYGGVFEFGDRDMDGSEAHGWLTPLNHVPALCNVEGGCI